MKNILFTVRLLCLSIVLICCSALPSVKQAGPCIPHFPDQDGWYGADGAYSIQLDERRTLWLFGDTFVSEDEGRKNRVGMDVVMGNTLAVSTCKANHDFSIRYFLKKKQGKFVPFFGENEFLWPQDPFIVRNVLYVPLLIVQGLPDADPPFNFKIAGHKIARIQDYSSEDPGNWPVDYLDWTHATADGIEALAPTSVVYDNYVYFYPLFRYAKDKVNISGNILARISIDDLSHPAPVFEYFNLNGTWTPRFSPENVKIVLDAAVSELSVRYHPENNHWLAVYLSPENKGRKLLYQTASRPEGPWSEPQILFEPVSEVDPASSRYDKQTFCYAGKEHRQFSRHNHLIVTYVCNSSEDLNLPAGFLRKNLFLYRPVVKQIRHRP